MGDMRHIKLDLATLELLLGTDSNGEKCLCVRIAEGDTVSHKRLSPREGIVLAESLLDGARDCDPTLNYVLSPRAEDT